jgi:hypothetical protein
LSADPRMTMKTLAAALVGSVVLLAGCATSPTPPAPAPLSPNDACRALLDSLNAAVAPGQSLADLQARGIRLRTPLSFPPGTVPRPQQSSGAVVQMLIQPDGTVLPGSPKTLKSVGEPQIGPAMEAGALSMQFELDGMNPRPTEPIPYTTMFAVCNR